MNMLWLRHPEQLTDLSLDINYDPMRHYDSVDVKLQGQLRDLRDIIPGKFHKEFENHMFWKEFKKQMQQQRSNGISRIRLYAGPAIFDCKASDLATVTRRMRFKEEIGFVEEADGTTRYKALCPIIYKEYEGRHDKTKIFLNPALFQVYTALVRGSAAVKGKGETVGRPPLDDTWGLKSTGITPGAIAVSTIYTHRLNLKFKVPRQEAKCSNLFNKKKKNKKANQPRTANSQKRILSEDENGDQENDTESVKQNKRRKY
ncbi:hypothetical protein M422DRAFT_267723 [Sphaerobolus stellatus SS14]|uniref:Uncharacterized protein n=1 Tax=Sphaerobolus stellatus (strain SS14) TaxID=990650 RepID=A0A0C9UP41_SPHS4|nr:hypothetical protein M422DRAFT_267723 [Sphaerobolus stellatus SS14]